MNVAAPGLRGQRVEPKDIVEPILSFAAAAGAASAIGALAVKDHRRARAARRSLLNDCLGLLVQERVEYGGDGFPRLTGTRAGRSVRAELIPDTMTIKRLPQLWLSVTVLEPLPTAASLAVLVRPSGNDFYSLTGQLETALDPPPALPWEVMARGSGGNPQTLLNSMAPLIGAILADPRIKEVAITRKGLRIIRQAGEGRRGEHLLLRQAVFAGAAVPAADLQSLLDSLDGLHTAVRETPLMAK